jgi:putative AdoMet-dependent methyltransferase
VEIDPFPPGDFDDWAETYDRSILNENRFPFFGYQQVLGTVVRLSSVQPGMRVLDLGTGTGNLAAAFAALGCEVWATDFSPKMLVLARRKLPQVQFVQADLRSGWPDGVDGQFDRMVSAYVFHHFELADKVRLSSMLIKHLSPHGKLVVADIAFPDYASQEKVQQLVGADWEEEFYWLADETLVAYHNAGLQAYFEPVSLCAGVFVIT